MSQFKTWQNVRFFSKMKPVSQKEYFTKKTPGKKVFPIAEFQKDLQLILEIIFKHLHSLTLKFDWLRTAANQEKETSFRCIARKHLYK